MNDQQTKHGPAMTNNKPPPKKFPIRPVSQNAYDAILMDSWPSPAGVLDFGIDSPEHLGALQYEFRTGRVTLDQFDDALGWGPALNKLIGEDNPYRDVTFKTKWDALMVPISEWATVTEELFPIGRLFATPEALKAATQTEIIDALRRHAAGDWGDGDKAENEAELKDGNEILSCYRTADGSPLFIRTWFTPPMTLALLEWQLDL
jgi:hypothetical protein